jgi:hypothetical protein
MTNIILLIDTTNRAWLTGVAPRRDSPGRAARGSVVPRKMACHQPRGRQVSFSVQGHRLALKGQPSRCPFKLGREWTPRRSTLLYSPPCRCSAQCSLGQGTVILLARSFLRSVQSRLSAQPMGSGVEGNARGCDGGVRQELATRIGPPRHWRGRRRLGSHSGLYRIGEEPREAAKRGS